MTYKQPSPPAGSLWAAPIAPQSATSHAARSGAATGGSDRSDASGPIVERFDGATFDPTLDGVRLTGQLERVRDLMADGAWRTLAEIAAKVEGSEPGVSARLRDLRKPRFGGLAVERKRTDRAGVWVYRVKGESE